MSLRRARTSFLTPPGQRRNRQQSPEFGSITFTRRRAGLSRPPLQADRRPKTSNRKPVAARIGGA
jgi:hypothetical protein